MIDDQGYEGNNINGIIDLTDKGIGVRPLIHIMGLTGLMDKRKQRLIKKIAKKSLLLGFKLTVC